MDSMSRMRWDDSRENQDFADDWNPRETDESESTSNPVPGPLVSALADMSLRFSVRDPAPSGLERNSIREPDSNKRSRAIQFPRIGEVLRGFRLVGELGRGAFARVYLAEQVDLAGRPVALKVSRAIGDEPYALARLQHAHIVPIHSVHDDPKTGLRLLCMPYLGGANLAQVLEMSGARLPSAATGQSLLEALDRLDARQASAAPLSRGDTIRTPAPSQERSAEGFEARFSRSTSESRSLWWRQLLRWTRIAGFDPDNESTHPSFADEGASPAIQPARLYYLNHTYVQASVWIVARLAEALEHAHARGLLHRDLKPSNVLIAADGSPMLLDFNLSADLDPSEPQHALLGGTLPYMAPEHLDAFNPEGITPASAVDERADLYALGLILFEMLTGHHPFPDPPADLKLPVVLRLMVEDRQKVPSARSLNSEVPHSLNSILKMCLDPEPCFRYDRAGEFAEDLRRFLDDRPLALAPEPSLTESAAKWLRRHPEARSSTTIGLLATFLIVSVAGLTWFVADRYEAQAEGYRRKQFASVFRECQILLNTSSGPRSHLGRGLELANQELLAFGLFNLDPRAPNSASWQPPMPHLLESERQALSEELAELILLKVRSEVALSNGQSEPKRRAVLKGALPWLDRAEVIDPHPPSALYQERARLKAALGRSREAAVDREKAANRPPETARDYYLLGTASASDGHLESAEVLLSRSVALDSRQFWAWFALGLCHYDQGRFAEAATDFAACTILAPTFAWPYLNRGLSLARLGRLTEAQAAYDQALAVNPDFLQARIDRALCELERNLPKRAEQDLARALQLGSTDPAVLAAHAEALARLGRKHEALEKFQTALRDEPRNLDLRVALGFFLLTRDPSAARDEFEHVLATDPNQARALLGLARLVRSEDPQRAVTYLDHALKASPNLLDAVQVRALVRARQGNFKALDDVDRLCQTPTPYNLYNAACSLALLADHSSDHQLQARALNLLKRALDAGFAPEEAATDPDFASLHALPEFQSLVSSAHAGHP